MAECDRVGGAEDGAARLFLGLDPQMAISVIPGARFVGILAPVRSIA